MFLPLPKWLSKRPACRQPIRRSVKPTLEALEERYAPAVLTVTSTADDGTAGTLRTLIANVHPGDTINFSSTIAGQTITLDPFKGDLFLPFSVTIDGGGNNISISGGNAVRIFYSTNATSETIENLTLENGSVNGLGAAVYFGSTIGTATLYNDTFDNNTATDGGGAVYSDAVTLTVTNCHFNNNTATNGSGGAIDVPGSSSHLNTVTLDGCGFTGNQADSSGGAVYVSTASNFTNTPTLTVKDACAFSNNKVTGSGGGGAIDTTDQLVVSASTSAAANFSNNSAPGAGGAIYFDPLTNLHSSMSLSNTLFYDNSAGLGGAVASNVLTNQNVVTETVTGCLFNDNWALGGSVQNGGALWVNNATSASGSASLTVTNDTFYDNTAGNDGGGLFLQNSNSGSGTNTVQLTSLTVTDNTAANAGGGVWIDPGMIAGLQVQIWNSIIAGNFLGNGQPASDGPDVFGVGTVKSLGYNLIGETDGTFTNPNNNPWLGSDYTGTAANPLNPGLDPKGPTNNGGPTNTIKLVSGSPAYRHGDPTLAGTKDQRGYTRQSTVSIGAYDPDATP